MCVLVLDPDVDIETTTVQLELQKALLNDIRVLDYNKDLGNGEFKPIYKLRENLPFWLKNSKGIIENKVYFMYPGINKNDVLDYLKREQIYIHKDFYNTNVS